MITQKLSNIRNFLQEEKLDSIFITSPSNIAYASNFVSRLSTEREAYVLITQTHAYIFVSKLYLEEVIDTQEMIARELTVQDPLKKQLKEIIEKEKLKSVGFEEENLTYKEYASISKHIPKLIPTDVFYLRERKSSEEIEKIAKACDIGDKAFSSILTDIKEGITEENLALKLENYIREEYAALSFPTIIAFGKNAAVPHHATGKTKLEKNQFVLLDFGVLFENYCSDMTRTIFFGSPTQREKHAYETVKIAQEKAIEYVKNSYSSSEAESRIEKPFAYSQDKDSSRLRSNNKVNASDVDKIARDYIVSKGFPSFPHSLGHGIGIDVHESPSLSPYSKDVLTSGMVFSVEPGIYIDHSLGIRIEDLVTLERSNFRTLTHAPKELITV